MTIKTDIRDEFRRVYFCRHCGCRQAASLAQKWGAEKSRLRVSRLAAMIHRAARKSEIDGFEDRKDIEERLRQILA